MNIGYTFSSGESSSAATDIDVDEQAHRLDTILAVAPLQDVDFDLEVPDEFNYTFGFAVAAGARVTLGFDVRGRTLRNVPRFQLQDNTYPNREQGPLPSGSFIEPDEFTLRDAPGNLNLALGIVGAKINIAKTLLLNVSVIFPMTDNGLKPKPTPVIGFDYVF